MVVGDLHILVNRVAKVQDMPASASATEVQASMSLSPYLVDSSVAHQVSCVHVADDAKTFGNSLVDQPDWPGLPASSARSERS